MADRILTTHGGRLQRPARLTDAINDDPRGRPAGDAGFASALRESVADIVREQRRDGVERNQPRGVMWKRVAYGT